MMLPKLFIVRAPRRACFTCRFPFSSSCAKSDKNLKDQKTPPETNKEHVAWRKQQLKSANLTLYPHKFDARDRISDVIRVYSDRLGKGDRADSHSDGESVSVAGRIHGVRPASKNLHFFDLKSGDGEIQVKANAKSYDPGASFGDEVSSLRRGDVIGVQGVPCRTQAGELSIDASREH